MSIFEGFFLLLFAVALFGMYITIRRDLIQPPLAGTLGTSLAVMALLGYGFAKDLETGHALAVGLLIGLSFSGAAVIMAIFFKRHDPGAMPPIQPDGARHTNNEEP